MSNIMQKQAYNPALINELQQQCASLKQRARVAYHLKMLEAAIRFHAEAESIQISIDILRRCLRRAGAR